MGIGLSIIAGLGGSTTTSSAKAVATTTSATVDSTFLILAGDANGAYTCSSGLNGYGIPFQSIIVPSTGITLPVLNSSATHGNFGGIIVYAEVAFQYPNNNWSSALTAAQWQQLYDYQVNFNVRMAQLNVFPGPNYGASVVNSGCCNSGVEQMISFTDVSHFASAGIKANAGVSSEGLYHYPAVITNTTTTQQIASFGPSSDGLYPNSSVAAVINTFGARQQMAWFTSMDTTWSVTSNFVQHSWIHWMTRGLFAGRRRTLLNTQIDDVHLITDIYSPNGSEFRIRYQDLENLIPWMASINSRLPAGSNYIIELGHNGNGDIENSTNGNDGAKYCNPDGAIEYPDQIDTALEFQKPLGTGTNIWPDTPASYVWSLNCAKLDPLANWFTNTANLNAFAHISHTYSHMSLDNATYSDASKEISFNIAWMKQIGIWYAKKFSQNGLIPPAITGLHNGDVLRAWHDNNLTAVVGDNTRPILMNPNNEFWPLVTNMSVNGYDGMVVMPRWATTIYYNCDTPDCTTTEWIKTSAGVGNFTNLLNDARTTNTRHLLSLHQDPFMFHQANLRNMDVPVTTVGSQTGQFGLLQTWVETVLQELMRLTTWAVTTVKHDDLAVLFNQRMARDACNYKLTWNLNAAANAATSVTLTSNGNTCSAPIPITVPGPVTVSGGSATTDALGNDPTIMWVTMSGNPVTLTLGTPIAW
ncbi:hypothetical protein ANO11243_045160 [Dothideomycetidae sp. 11243]|nr:hypothetical protein ANO11243_045160 [fungal sp. No.11243]